MSGEEENYTRNECRRSNSQTVSSKHTGKVQIIRKTVPPYLLLALGGGGGHGTTTASGLGVLTTNTETPKVTETLQSYCTRAKPLETYSRIVLGQSHWKLTVVLD